MKQWPKTDLFQGWRVQLMEKKMALSFIVNINIEISIKVEYDFRIDENNNLLSLSRLTK